MTIESEFPSGLVLPGGALRPSRLFRRGLKRGLDIAIASAALFCTFPIMLLLAGLIRISTGGSVLFRHTRIGRGGGEFECLKFRTMVPDADARLEALLASDPVAAEEWRHSQKLAFDPRVTFIGHVLRRSSLDELPQLINVLRGEMSCVGPRPVTRNELQRYGIHRDVLLQLRPGMTGLWQVSGRSDLDYDRRVSLDCDYVRRWSLWLDLKILVLTVPALLNTRQTS